MVQVAQPSSAQGTDRRRSREPCCGLTRCARTTWGIEQWRSGRQLRRLFRSEARRQKPVPDVIGLPGVAAATSRSPGARSPRSSRCGSSTGIGPQLSVLSLCFIPESLVRHCDTRSYQLLRSRLRLVVRTVDMLLDLPPEILLHIREHLVLPPPYVDGRRLIMPVFQSLFWISPTLAPWQGCSRNSQRWSRIPS